MKQLYIALAALAVASGSLYAAPASENAVVSRAVKNPLTYTHISQFAGEYDWTFMSYMPGQTGEQSVKITATVKDAATNTLELAGFVDPRSKLKNPIAIVDIEAKTFSIPNNQLLGTAYGEQVYFFIKDKDASGNPAAGVSEAEATVADITRQYIIFPDSQVWAIGDLSASQPFDFYYLTSMNTFEQLTGGEITEEKPDWEDYCSATFEDGWAVVALNADPASYPWTVTIQKSNETPGLFRIHNPYMAEGCIVPAAYRSEGDIEFNVSNPDFVPVIPKIESGFNFGDHNNCYTNIEGFYAAMGYSASDVTSMIQNSNGNVSNYTDNVVTIYNCRYNYKGDYSSIKSWTTSSGESYPAVIKPEVALGEFRTAVEELGASCVAPVEYFSIDGTRLSEPAGVCIRRQGNQVSKIIIR